MGHTCNSITINAPYEKVFDISNDIPRWTELFGGEYKEAKVVKNSPLAGQIPCLRQRYFIL